MKQFIATLLAAAMLFSLTACGHSPAPAGSDLSASEEDSASPDAGSREPAASSSDADDIAGFSGSDPDGGESPISPSSGIPIQIPEQLSVTPVSGTLDDIHVDILSAEAFTDGSGKDAVRFYYDFTNTTSQPLSAMLRVNPVAFQDGVELADTWAMEDVPECYNNVLEVRPGITIRCIAEFNYTPGGGPLVFTLADFQGEESLSMQFDPASLPGRPAGEWTVDPIADPDWMDGLPAACDCESYRIGIVSTSIDADYSGDPMLRIYFDYTNKSSGTSSFLISVDLRVMQDGIELPSAVSADIIPEEENLTVEISPGETISVARSFVLRTESPVTVELYDWHTLKDIAGAVISIEK